MKQLAIFWKCSAEATNCFRVGFLLDAWTLPTPLFSTAEMPCPGPSRVISEFWEKHFKFFRHVENYDDRCNMMQCLSDVLELRHANFLALCGWTAHPIHLLMLLPLAVLQLSMFWTSNLIDLACLYLDFQMQLKLVLSLIHQRQAEQTWSLYQDDGHLKKQVDHGVNVSVGLYSDAVAFGSWWLPPLQRNIVQNWFGSM